jgi:hypothetical protein
MYLFSSLDPGWVKIKIRIRDEQDLNFDSLETIFWVKIF